MAEEPAGDVLLLGRQLGQRTLQVLLDDVLCAAEPLEGLDPQHVGSRGSFLLPEPLEHELEVGRLDTAARGGALDRAQTAERRLDLPGADLVQDPLDELGLCRHRLPDELAVALERTDDRGSRSCSVEAVESKRVREQPGDAAGEAIELGEGVLTQRHEDVHAERSPEHSRKRLGERPGACIVGVVQEVLLGLVEDEIDVPAGLRGLERLDRRARRSISERSPNGLRERRGGVLAPPREDDDQRLLGELSQSTGDGCAEQRRLADAARAVENGQA